MKNFVLNKLAEANINDEDFKLQVMESCAKTINDLIDREIQRYHFINDPANVHEELWQHNDSVFELDIAIENWDTHIAATITPHIAATITPQEETGNYICKLEKTCLGLDRDAIINEMYSGSDIREYVHYDYKKIMAMIYYDFEYELRSYLKEQ